MDSSVLEGSGCGRLERIVVARMISRFSTHTMSHELLIESCFRKEVKDG